MYYTVKLWHRGLKEYTPFMNRASYKCAWFCGGRNEPRNVTPKRDILFMAKSIDNFWGGSAIEIHVYNKDGLVYVACV